MDKKKSESAVEIMRKASKQTKREASLEQAKSITSSNSTKTSEQKEQKKENVLSFDNIKVYIVKMVVLCMLRRQDGLDQYYLFNVVPIAGKNKERASASNGAQNGRRRMGDRGKEIF